MSKSSTIKIWILTLLAFLHATYNFLSADSREAFELIQYFLGITGILVGAYFVTKKQKKSGIFLWLAGFTIPKISMMVFLGMLIPNFESQTMIVVIAAIMCIFLAICLIVWRLFLQWTTCLWKKDGIFNEREIHTRKVFWKYYINFECIIVCGAALALIPVIPVFIPELSSSETIFNWSILLIIVSISTFYSKYVKKRCLPLLIQSEDQVEMVPLKDTKNKKYWSGNLRLFSDIVWCILISLLLMWSNHSQSNKNTSTTIPNSSQIGQYIESSSQSGDYLKPRTSGEEISQHIASLIGSIVGTFFIFFFWSWNRKHLECRVARITVHFLCWTMFIIGFGTLVFLGWYYPRSLSEYTGWYVLILTTVWGMLIARKYKRLMWPKKFLEQYS